MSAAERTALAEAAERLFITLRGVVDDPVPGAELLRTREGQPVHRAPNCDLCTSASR